MKRVLFLDGIGCNPDGFKPRFIRECGYHVTVPQLPDLDFAASVAMANHALAETAPDVVVGYSRGGGVAMMLDDLLTPRLLIAPALRWVKGGRGCKVRFVILHSATDDSLPLDEVRAHLTRCDLSEADLRMVGEDHTMIDPSALAALTAALTKREVA